MPELKWVANGSIICDSEAEAMLLESSLRVIDGFLSENSPDDAVLLLEGTLAGAEFLKACLRVAVAQNPHMVEVLGEGIVQTLKTGL